MSDLPHTPFFDPANDDPFYGACWAIAQMKLPVEATDPVAASTRIVIMAESFALARQLAVKALETAEAKAAPPCIFCLPDCGPGTEYDPNTGTSACPRCAAAENEAQAGEGFEPPFPDTQ